MSAIKIIYRNLSDLSKSFIPKGYEKLAVEFLFRMREFQLILLFFLYIFGTVQSSEKSREVKENLPDIFFSLGWTKIGIVARNGRHFTDMVKDQKISQLGFTFRIQENLLDFENDYGSFDGFYLDDGLTIKNLKEISAIVKYVQPYRYLILNNFTHEHMDESIEETVERDFGFFRTNLNIATSRG